MSDDDEYGWADATDATPHTQFPGLAPADCDRIMRSLEDVE